MTPGYRNTSLTCPRCGGELLAKETGEGAIIDACKECQGMWVDWLDGELADMADEVSPAAGEEPRARGDAAAAAGTGDCPRCNKPLFEEHYLGDGPLILRCGECSGAFVPRASAAALADHRVPEAEAVASEEAGFLRRLMDRVRAALAPEAP